MGEDPRTIQQQVEQTRERMGDTVEALAYKADVKTRAKDNVSEKTGKVKEFFSGAADSVNESTPSTGDVKQAARKGAGLAKENPLGLAIGAVAIGFLGGLLVPASRIENEKIGPVADQVKGQIGEAAQTVAEHGKEAAQEAAQAATQAVKETGQEHVEQAKDDVTQQVGSTS